MSEPRPTNWVAVLVFLITGYVVIFAQARVDAFRGFSGTQPDLLPGMIAYAAIAFHLEVALGCATALGLLFDSLSANAFGTTALTLGVLTLGVIRYREVLLSDQFVARWTLGLCASAFAPLLSVGLLHLAGAQPLVGLSSLWHWAVMTGVGGLVTPFWFKFFDRLDDALRYKEIPEPPARTDRELERGRH